MAKLECGEATPSRRGASRPAGMRSLAALEPALRKLPKWPRPTKGSVWIRETCYFPFSALSVQRVTFLSCNNSPSLLLLDYQ